MYGGLDFVKPDITSMQNALGVAGFPKENILNLSGKAITKKDVLDNLTMLAGKAQVNDLVVIYFTGHGDQRKDQTPIEEPDSLDEVLVMADDYLFDDELNKKLQEFNKHQRIVVLIDACHSGTSIQLIDLRTKEEKKDDEMLERRKYKSDKVFEDEFEKKQRINAVSCSLQDYAENSNGLNLIYYGASADDEEGKSNTQGSFFTQAFAGKFRTFPATWKTLDYRSLFCEVASLVKSSSSGHQNAQYKEIGDVSAFQNVYPLKIK